MRTVAAKDSESPRLETVLTARANPVQACELLPQTEQPDELSSPGPTRVARVQLSSGHDAVVVIHERADFIEVLAPLDFGVEVGLADLLINIAVAPDAITWTHDEIDRDLIAALHRSRTSLSRTPFAIPSTTVSETRARRKASVQVPSVREEQATHLHRKYHPRVVRFFKACRVSEEDAEDLTQEAFMRFFESLPAYRGDAEWPLLETVARSVFLNRLRAQFKAKKRDSVSAVDLDEVKNSAALSVVPDPVAHEQAVLRRKSLHDAIAALPRDQRQCIQLWLDGFDRQQIAHALRTNAEAVKSNLDAAKKQLRNRLGDEQFAHE